MGATMSNEINPNIPILGPEDIFEGNEHFYIHLSTDYSDYENRLHMHSFAEISYIVSGEAEHQIGGMIYRVHRGDIIAIKRNTPHTFRPVECGEPFVAYDIMFTESLFRGVEFSEEFRAMLTALLGEEDSGYDFHISGGTAVMLGETVHKLYTEFRSRGSAYMDIIRAYVFEFLVLFFRKVYSDSENKLSVRLRSAVRSTIAYIEDNYRRPLTLEELANRIYFSKDYLNKVFHSAVGMPVGSYIKKMRLETAMELLLTTDKTVSEIAALSGFGDVKSFYTVFKRDMKMTPGEYRRSRLDR